jgi:hypothetical protein
MTNSDESHGGAVDNIDSDIKAVVIAFSSYSK